MPIQNQCVDNQGWIGASSGPIEQQMQQQHHDQYHQGHRQHQLMSEAASSVAEIPGCQRAYQPLISLPDLERIQRKTQQILDNNQLLDKLTGLAEHGEKSGGLELYGGATFQPAIKRDRSGASRQPRAHESAVDVSEQNYYKETKSSIQKIRPSSNQKGLARRTNDCQSIEHDKASKKKQTAPRSRRATRKKELEHPQCHTDFGKSFSQYSISDITQGSVTQVGQKHKHKPANIKCSKAMSGVSVTSSHDRTCPTPLTVSAHGSQVVYREQEDRLSTIGSGPMPIKNQNQSSSSLIRGATISRAPKLAGHAARRTHKTTNTQLTQNMKTIDSQQPSSSAAATSVHEIPGIIGHERGAQKRSKLSPAMNPNNLPKPKERQTEKLKHQGKKRSKCVCSCSAESESVSKESQCESPRRQQQKQEYFPEQYPINQPRPNQDQLKLQFYLSGDQINQSTSRCPVNYDHPAPEEQQETRRERDDREPEYQSSMLLITSSRRSDCCAEEEDMRDDHADTLIEKFWAVDQMPDQRCHQQIHRATAGSPRHTVESHGKVETEFADSLSSKAMLQQAKLLEVQYEPAILEYPKSSSDGQSSESNSSTEHSCSRSSQGSSQSRRILSRQHKHKQRIYISEPRAHTQRSTMKSQASHQGSIQTDCNHQRERDMSPVINHLEQEIGGLKHTNFELRAQIDKLTKTQGKASQTLAKRIKEKETLIQYLDKRVQQMENMCKEMLAKKQSQKKKKEHEKARQLRKEQKEMANQAKKAKDAQATPSESRDKTDQSFAELCVNLAKSETQKGQIAYYDASKQAENPRPAQVKKSPATRTRSKGQSKDFKRSPHTPWDSYSRPDPTSMKGTSSWRPASSISPPKPNNYCPPRQKQSIHSNGKVLSPSQQSGRQTQPKIFRTLRAEGSLSKEKSRERRRGHVPVLSQTFVIGKSLELALQPPNGRTKSEEKQQNSRSRAGSVQSIRSLEPSPRSSTKHAVLRRIPENPDECPIMTSNAYAQRKQVQRVEECTLYSNDKSERDIHDSSIIKIENKRRSSCHSSPNFKDNDDFACQDYSQMTEGGFKVQEFERPESVRISHNNLNTQYTEPDVTGAPEHTQEVPKPIDFASQENYLSILQSKTTAARTQIENQESKTQRIEEAKNLSVQYLQQQRQRQRSTSIDLSQGKAPHSRAKSKSNGGSLSFDTSTHLGRKAKQLQAWQEKITEKVQRKELQRATLRQQKGIERGQRATSCEHRRIAREKQIQWLKQQEQAIVQEGVIEMEAIKVGKCMTFSDAFRSAQKSGQRGGQGATESKPVLGEIQIKKFEISTSTHTTPKGTNELSARLIGGPSAYRPSNQDLEDVPEPQPMPAPAAMTRSSVNHRQKCPNIDF